MVNRRVQNAVFGCNLTNDRMNSVRFQGKPFNITEIQVYAPTSDAEEAEVERFCEDLQDLVELTPQKDVLFIIGDWNAFRLASVISSCIDPFIIIWCFSLAFVTVFVLMSVLSNMSIATPAFLHEILLMSLTFS